jgi:hypothetical protein
MARNYVLLRVDTKNGSSAGTARFFLQRNQGYVLFLDREGGEKARLRSKPTQTNGATAKTILAKMREFLGDQGQGLRGATLLERLSTSPILEERRDAKRWVAMTADSDKASKWWLRTQAASSSKQAILELVAALDHRQLRPFAIRTLGDYGKAASTVLPRFLDDLQAEKKHLDLILEQFPRIDPQGLQTRRAIQSARTHRDPKVKSAANRAWEKLQPLKTRRKV